MPCEKLAIISMHGCKLDWGYVLGPYGAPSLAEETCQFQIVFAMCYVQFSSVAQ